MKRKSGRNPALATHWTFDNKKKTSLNNKKTNKI